MTVLDDDKKKKEIEATMLTDETLENVRRAEENFRKADRSFDCSVCGARFTRADRSFDCSVCGARFTPAEGQWIFHELCNDCFRHFDYQKMCGRFGGIVNNPSCKHQAHFESAKAWGEDARKWFVAFMEAEIPRIEAGGELSKRFEGRTREQVLESMRAELQYFQSRAPS